MSRPVMWAVGPEGDEPWHAIRAKSARGAISTYIDQWGGTRKYMDAVRVEAWDNLEKVKRPDWLRAGLGAICDGMTWQEDGGCIISEQVFCEYCKPKGEE